MKVIAIVGYSGSGKTTLVEKLLPLLCASGLKVATIKHTHHRVTLDTPGKDSWRFKQAGAVASMLVTPEGLQLVADPMPSHNAVSVGEPELLAQHYFPDADLVLAESFSDAQCDKIEVLRAACSVTPRCRDGLIAMVSDVATVYPHLPHFALDDVDGIAQFLLARVRECRVSE